MLEACARRRIFKSSLPADRAATPSPFFREINRVKIARLIAAALAAIVAATATPALTATTPKPSPAPRPAPIVIHLPPVPLHTEVVVEVNKKGQVVRVKSTKPCKVQTFNLQTYGNALQMWIRRPDGTAQVGLYRITYDYNPKTQDVTRRVSLISAGGSWANDEGAANVMVEMERKQAAAAAEAQRRAQEQQNAKLPSLNEIRGLSPTPKPTIGATLPPV
jgi:hypothetical protein